MRKEKNRQSSPFVPGSKKAAFQNMSYYLEEVIDLLKISKSTMQDYCNAALLVRSRIRATLRFNKDDPEEAHIQARRYFLFAHFP